MGIGTATLLVSATVLTSTVFLYALWLGAVAFLGGRRSDPDYPAAEPNTFAVLIAARNEETVIGPLVESLRQQTYPKEQYKIFVVAHNCTDQTAERARSAGAEVFERNAEGEYKVNALVYGLERVEEKYGDTFTYVAVFDADALADRHFLAKMNDALSATDADCAAGYYASKNFGKTTVSRLSGMVYHGLMHGNSMANGRLHLPVNVYGSGYAFKYKWKHLFVQIDTLVSDFEFSCLLVLHGAKLIAAPRAVVYAEMPETLREGLKQRKRWAFGDTQCYKKYRKDFHKAIFTRGKDGFKQYMDLIMNPFVSLTAVGAVLWSVLFLSGEIAVPPLPAVLGMAAAVYGIFEVWIARTLRAEHIPFKGNGKAMLLLPFWGLLSGVFAVESFFLRRLQWEQTKRYEALRITDLPPRDTDGNEKGSS